MPATVTCPSCNTTLRPKTPVPAGTRIKCPKCQTVFAVPDDEGEVAAAPPPRAAAPREEPDDLAAMTGDTDDAGAPAERGARRPAKKGGVPLWVWLVGGAGVLLLVCCGVCGGFGYWGYNMAKTAGSGNVTLLNYAQIQKGASEAEVTTLLGTPASQATVLGNKTVTWQDGANTITVIFTGDKATDRSCHLTTSGGVPIDQTGFSGQ